MHHKQRAIFVDWFVGRVSARGTLLFQLRNLQNARGLRLTVERAPAGAGKGRGRGRKDGEQG
eukprot:2751846-Prymnesium_polylepis.1